MNQTENVPFYAGIPFLIIGLIGNLLVIQTVHKIPEMHTPPKLSSGEYGY